MIELPLDVLNLIFIQLVTSTNGARDLVQISKTCKKLKEIAGQTCALRVVSFQGLTEASSCERFIFQCARVRNQAAECILRKVEDGEGDKHWKRVEVKAEDHIKLARFPEGLSVESYDHYFNEYLSKIAMDPLPQTRPLWEIHIIKYPTSNANGSLVFKLHHALGDGFSLMGALLSCLQRADNPSLPLTFPNFQKSSKVDNEIKSLINALPKALSGALNTVLDSDECKHNL